MCLHHVSIGNPQQSMSERICRALAAAEGSTDWQRFKPGFKAMLAALRKPSVNMLEAATAIYQILVICLKNGKR